MMQCTCWPVSSNKLWVTSTCTHQYDLPRNIQWLFNIIYSWAELLTTCTWLFKSWPLCKYLVYQTWRLPEMNYCLKFTKWHKKRKATKQTKQWVYYYFVSQIKLIITGIHICSCPLICDDKNVVGTTKTIWNVCAG